MWNPAYSRVASTEADAVILSTNSAFVQALKRPGPTRSIAIFVVGAFIGLIIAKLSAGPSVSHAIEVNQDELAEVTDSPFSIEKRLTSSPHPVLIPTQIPTPAQPRPTHNPSYPPFKYEIDNVTLKAWVDLEAARLKAFPGMNGTTYTLYRDVFCPDQMKNHPEAFKIKYEFPPQPSFFENEDPFGWNPEQVLHHITAYQYALANYYHWPTEDLNGCGAPLGTPTGEATVNRIALHFYKKLVAAKQSRQPIKIAYGFMGTSVMSGQDNCYIYTLAPLLNKILPHLFAPLHPVISIRNQGQNGDSPEQLVQLFCAQATLGEDLDFLHLWFPMMPQTSFAMKEFFIRSWFNQTNLAQVTIGSGDFDLDNFMETGFMSTVNFAIPSNQVDWTAFYHGEFGGVRGDKMCRFVTRVHGAAAVLKQNWHYGPLGFQFIADGISDMLIKGMKRALGWMISPPDKFPILPPVPNKLSTIAATECSQKCASRQCRNFDKAANSPFEYQCDPNQVPPGVVCTSDCGPQFASEASLRYVWNAKSVSTRAEGLLSTPWEWVLVKVFSRIHAASERWEMKYDANPNCSAFLDIGWGYESRANFTTDWLEITWTAQASKRLQGYQNMNVFVCTGRRWNYPPYTSVPGPNWFLDWTVDGKQIVPPYNTQFNNQDIWYNCIWVNPSTFIPVPEKPNTKFAFRFRRNQPFNVTQKILIGNIFFIGAK